MMATIVMMDILNIISNVLPLAALQADTKLANSANICQYWNLSLYENLVILSLQDWPQVGL